MYIYVYEASLFYWKIAVALCILYQLINCVGMSLNLSTLPFLALHCGLCTVHGYTSHEKYFINNFIITILIIILILYLNCDVFQYKKITKLSVFKGRLVWKLVLLLLAVSHR